MGISSSRFGRFTLLAFIRLLGIFSPSILFFIYMSVMGELMPFIPLLATVVAQVVIFCKYALPSISEWCTNLLLSANVSETTDIFNKAELLHVHGKTQEAYKLILQHIRKYPKDFNTRIKAAQWLSQTAGEHVHALQMFEKTARVKKWNKEQQALLLYKMANLHAHQLNNPQKAYELWTQAASNYPNTAYGRAANKHLGDGI